MRKYILQIVKIFIGVVIISIYCGCSVSGYEKFYKQVLPEDRLQALKESGKIFPTTKVKLYTTTSEKLQEDNEYLREECIYIGYSSFNGELGDYLDARYQAIRVNANAVLLYSKYTHTEVISGTLFLPTSKTAFYNGNINTHAHSTAHSYGRIGNDFININSHGNSYGSGSYSGSVTVYGNEAIPYTRTSKRYDQFAWYFFCE